MQRIVLIVALCGISLATLAGDDKTLVFSHPPSGFGPFTTTQENAPASGIMVEALREIVSPEGYVVITDSTPRQRLYARLKAELFDVAAIAREWVEAPDDFAFSEPVVVLRDVIFSLRERPLSFSGPGDLFGKRVGTHRGYVYPTVDEYFKAGQIVRDDSGSELAMLKKVLVGRSDAAIVEEAAGLWIIKQQGWQGKFHLSKQAVDSVGFRLMFSKKWAPMIPAFNRELARLKENGQLDGILARYR